MIATDEDALICDLAETYGIFNYRGLPVKLLATLSIGLREDSRIKMKISGTKVPLNTMLLGATVDRLSMLLWAKTKDGSKGINRPASIVEMITSEGKELEGFNTGEEFEEARRKILEGR